IRQVRAELSLVLSAVSGIGGGLNLGATNSASSAVSSSGVGRWVTLFEGVWFVLVALYAELNSFCTPDIPSLNSRIPLPRLRATSGSREPNSSRAIPPQIIISMGLKPNIAYSPHTCDSERRQLKNRGRSIRGLMVVAKFR